MATIKLGGLKINCSKGGLAWKMGEGEVHRIGSGAGKNQSDADEYEGVAAGDYDGNFDAEYNEDGYEPEGEYAESPEDEYAGEPYADDETYAQDDSYADESAYAEDAYEDEYGEDPGYDPNIFENLGGDEDADDGYAPEYDDAVDETEYDENEYGEAERYDEEPSGGFLGFLDANDWVMYAALVILPPLGIYLLWRKNRFDITLRAGITAVSAIWFVILLFLIFSGLSKSQVEQKDIPAITAVSIAPSVSPAGTVNANASAATNPSAEPTTTPRVTNTDSTGGTTGGAADGTAGTTGGATGAGSEYVYMTNSGIYYHNIENCGTITNASKVLLETAKTRGLSACPNCIGAAAGSTGGGSTGAGTGTLYATNNGKWFHLDPTCQDMKNAQITNEASAVAAGKTACPKCIGYYGREGGNYYHVYSNCSKMKNAVTNTKEYWEKSGKKPCPVCMATKTEKDTAKAETATYVYATQGGKYFHTKSNCTGMVNAKYVTIQSAVSANKTACPKCVTPAKVYVFATKTGTYFHTKSNCSGMDKAVRVTAKVALEYGKKACPECAKMLSAADSTVSNVPDNVNIVNTSDTKTYVYATAGGTWYHTKSDCSGMVGAKKVTITSAVNAGKTACPECIKTSTVTVFCTAGGTWYHTNKTCSGMAGAVAVKAKDAIANGKTACPTCAKMFSSSSPNAGGGNAQPNTSTPTTGSAGSTVYIDLDVGALNYYHKGAKCSKQGVSGCTAVTLEYALDHGYKSCPSCNPPSKISS